MEEYTNYNKEEVVYEDTVCLALLPKKGPSLGFIKVIPKQICKSFSELPEEVVIQLFYVASYAATAVFEGLGAQGTNIIVNDGDFKKSSDYQLSLSVIPRKEGDGMDFKWKTSDPSQEDLESTKNRISEQTFLIGKEKKPSLQNNDADSTNFEPEKMGNGDGEEEENYLVKHLIRIP